MTVTRCEAFYEIALQAKKEIIALQKREFEKVRRQRNCEMQKMLPPGLFKKNVVQARANLRFEFQSRLHQRKLGGIGLANNKFKQSIRINQSTWNDVEFFKNWF